MMSIPDYVRHANVHWASTPLGILSPLIVALIAGYLRNVSNRLKTAYQELSIAYATIQKQALTDVLTGLPNHRALMDQLSKEIERTRRYGRPLSLLFFDADRFKHVNDTYGHPTGDAVLARLANELAMHCAVEIRWDALEAKNLSFYFLKLLPRKPASSLNVSVAQ